MSGKQPPLFVQRRTYRRRRIADGARLLPVFGGLLFLIPLLWKGGAEGGGEDAGTAWAMIYIFLVWLGLIVLSGVMSQFLRSEEDSKDDGEDGGEGR